MYNKKETLVARMRQYSGDIVREAIKEWATTDFHRRRSALDILLEEGWEVIDVDNSVLILPDGRPVVRDAGVPMALRLEVYQERRATMFPENNQDEGVQQTPGESLTSVLCPACQSVMAKSPVCPSCEKGQAGFKIVCICTQCNNEVYL